MSSLIVNKAKTKMFGFSLLSALCYVQLLYTSVLLSTNNCSVDLYNGHMQSMTVFFTHNSTKGWLNSYYSSSAFSCPFIVLVFSLTHVIEVERLLEPSHFCLCIVYTVLLVHSIACVLRTHCCLCILILIYTCCCSWFTYN